MRFSFFVVFARLHGYRFFSHRGTNYSHLLLFVCLVFLFPFNRRHIYILTPQQRVDRTPAGKRNRLLRRPEYIFLSPCSILSALALSPFFCDYDPLCSLALIVTQFSDECSITYYPPCTQSQFLFHVGSNTPLHSSSSFDK